MPGEATNGLADGYGQSTDNISQIINRISAMQKDVYGPRQDSFGGSASTSEISALHEYLKKLLGYDPFGTVGNDPIPQAAPAQAGGGGGGGGGGGAVGGTSGGDGGREQQRQSRVMEKLNEEMLRAQVENMKSSNLGRSQAIDAAKNVLKIKAPWLMSSLSRDPRNQVY